ncbi:putative bifunctional diguanylate cyclase/phosphodiesterase [Psychrobacter namhaensis]|uniref:putative bifunctional diguanylate cyclase/phosphodiesterase n=1 Tax=Psychrobacter namhaensis TaxID=292734 RepID=UPI003D05957A
MTTFAPIPVADKQQLLAKLCEQLDDAIFILDANLRYLWVNASYEIMIGYREAFMLGRPLGIYAAEFLSEEEKAILADIISHLDSSGFYENHFSMPNRYGQILECHMTYRKICIAQTVYYVGMVRDVSSAIKDQRQVAHLLNYDQLTGLPNRKVFLSQTSDLLLDSYQEVVIVRFNIDRYRSLASLLGPDGINLLVQDFVTRVKALKLDNLHCFSHFGGDDFAFLFECHDANMIRHQLDSLMQMCERPFTLGENAATEANIYCRISVGVSYFPENDDTLIGLLTKAEKALHYVKQQGGDDICWYDTAIDEATDGSLQLESELRAATTEGQFVPYYQPKFELATGIITGFEALVRWQHPTRGLLKPVHFINAILTHKLSFELFSQMAIQIAKQLSAWQHQGFCQHICINADAAEFSHPDFFEMVSKLFIQHNISAHQLHIEVTESSLIQRHANVKKQLDLLKELGVFLALDDFGTGYASLSYLQEYPFDFIKIDKSFITNIETDRTQHAIVKAILDLAVALDMQVIAEGIETEEQRDVLLAMDCQYGQGYWFGKPVTADVATKMLIQQDATK